jgi:hypothetical protein
VESVLYGAGALNNGYTINQVNLTDEHILKASLLSKFYGQKVYLVAIMQPDFGMMIDMAQAPTIDKDLEISYNISVEKELAPEFITLLAKANMINRLGFTPILNFNVGETYIGKKAYVYMLNETKTSYDLINSTDVDIIGNVAFTSDKLTDYIILIEK